MDGFHGQIYQLKMTMLCLHRAEKLGYSCKVQSEVKDQDKFEDIAFKCEQGNETICRYFQIKHKSKTRTQDLISSGNLLNEKDPFSLIQYYFSHQENENTKQKKGQNVQRGRKVVIKDKVICTNTDFYISDLKKAGIELEPLTEQDEILDVISIKEDSQNKRFKKTMRYKFKVSIIPLLLEQLKTCRLSKLAGCLADCIQRNKTLNQSDGIFRIYHPVLGKEVIDIENKKFQTEFIKGVNLSPSSRCFRTFFEKELKNIDKRLTLENLNEAITNEKVLNRRISLQLNTGFGAGSSEQREWPENKITHQTIEDFLNKLVFAVNLPNEEELGKILEREIGYGYNYITQTYLYDSLFVKLVDFLLRRPGCVSKQFFSDAEVKELLKVGKKKILYPVQQYEEELRFVSNDRKIQLREQGELQFRFSLELRVFLLQSDAPSLSSLTICQESSRRNSGYVFLPLGFLLDDPEIHDDEEADLIDIFTDGDYAAVKKTAILKNYQSIETLSRYRLHILAKNLADFIQRNQSLSQSDDIFQTYHQVLAKEVIDVKNKKFQMEFIKNEKLSSTTKLFRKIFEKELKNIDNRLTLENLNHAIENEEVLNRRIGLELNEGFGEGVNESQDWDRSEISDEKMCEFLNKLVFVFNLPNIEELQSLLKQEIGPGYYCITKTYLYDRVIEKILEEMPKLVKRFFNDTEAKELLKVKTKIPPYQAQEYEDVLRDVFSEWKKQAGQQSEPEFLFSLELRVWIIKSCSPWLSSLAVYQELSRSKLKYVFFTWEFLLDHPEIIYDFKEAERMVIICSVCDKANEKAKCIAESVKNVVSSSEQVHKKFIFITPDREFLALISNYVPCFQGNLSVTFSDLLEESQKSLLQEKLIRLQGSVTKTSINEILGEEQLPKNETELDAVLEILLRNGELDLWKKQRTFSDMSALHYKPQSRLEMFQIQKAIHSNQNDIFAFEGFEESVKELLPDEHSVLHSFMDILRIFKPSDHRFILLNAGGEGEEQFMQLCELIDETVTTKLYGTDEPALHLLKQNEGGWLWIRTYNRKIYVQRNLCRKRNHLGSDCEIFSLSDDNLANSDEKIILITAESGSGKSLTLAHVAETIKKENPTSLVLKVDHQVVKKFQSKTSHIFPLSRKIILDFLSFSCGETKYSTLERKLLPVLIQRRKHVIFLLDGYDELTCFQRNWVLCLFGTLQEQTKAAVWITTRCHDDKVKIENKLRISSYTFESWERKLQAGVLSAMWDTALKFSIQRAERSFRNGLEERAETLLNYLSNDLEVPEDILDTPLILRMVAEIYLKNVDIIQPKTYLKCKTMKMEDFYHVFVNKKYDTYLHEKLNAGSILDAESINILKKEYTKAYGRLSFRAILHDSTDDIFTKEEMLSFSTLQKIGLINGNEDAPNFIHESFSEYFATERITCKLKFTTASSPISENLWSVLLDEILMLNNGRRFFNDKLSNDEKLARLLDRLEHKDTVFTLLRSQCHNGYSVLWYAAVNKLENMLDFLFKSANSFDSFEKMVYYLFEIEMKFDESPLAHLLKSILKRGKELDEFRLNETMATDLLHRSVRESNLESVDILINSISDSEKIAEMIQLSALHDDFGETVLHIAVKKNNFPIVEKCIEKLDHTQRSMVFSIRDFLHTMPLENSRGEEIYSRYRQYIANPNPKTQLLQQKRRLNLLKCFKSMALDMYTVPLCLELYLPPFEKTKTLFHNAIITRVFSQFLFLIDFESVMKMLKLIGWFYKLMFTLRPESKPSRLAEDISFVSCLTMLARELDLPDNTLPSKFLRHRGYKKLDDLRSYVTEEIGPTADFAIHLGVIGHVIAFYRINNFFIYFDSSVCAIKGIKQFNVALEIIESAVDVYASGYQVKEEGFLVEHFDVETANFLVKEHASKEKGGLPEHVNAALNLIMEHILEEKGCHSPEHVYTKAIHLIIEHLLKEKSRLPKHTEAINLILERLLKEERLLPEHCDTQRVNLFKKSLLNCSNRLPEHFIPEAVNFPMQEDLVEDEDFPLNFDVKEVIKEINSMTCVNYLLGLKKYCQHLEMTAKRDYTVFDFKKKI